MGIHTHTTSGRITGLVAAPFTPMHEDGSLNLEAVKPYAEGLLRNGIGAAFVGGTTGEFASLTLLERQNLTAAWVKAAPPELKVVAHVGHTCLADACALAAHAQAVGADAIAAIAPFFFVPAEAGALTGFMQSVASAAPSLPFYYYHMPSMTGVKIKASDFVRTAADRIPTLAGVKFTHEDLDDFAECVSIGEGRFSMLFGRDEILLDGLSRGAQGAVGSTYNFAGPLNRRLVGAFNSGDLAEARRLQDISTRCINVLLGQHVPFLTLAKALMTEVGIHCGPTRPPLPRADRRTMEAVMSGLASLGFREHASRMTTSQ